jgi:hypothetical protein
MTIIKEFEERSQSLIIYGISDHGEFIIGGDCCLEVKIKEGSNCFWQNGPSS